MERACGKPAIVASLVLHGVVLAALVVVIGSATQTPYGTGVSGIAVSLAAGGGAAGGEAAPAVETVKDAATSSVPAAASGEDTPLIDPEPVEATAVDSVESTTAQPVSTVEPSTEAAVTAVETTAAIAPDPIQPAVDKAAEPVAAIPSEAADVPPETVAAAAPPKAAAKDPKDIAASTVPAAPKATQAAAATTGAAQSDRAAPSASSSAGAKTAGAVGPAAAERGGSEGAADYMALLRAWLEKHKHYPRRAQVRRLQGTALLYFAMDADGRVLSFRIERSSGHALLDAEVAAMIQRASPLPAAPASMRGTRLEFVVPVQFALR